MLANEKQTSSPIKAAIHSPARPCVFFQEVTLTADERGTPERENVVTGRCMLRPGRTCGPDGGAVLLTHCTPMRQEACQVQRRQTLARLIDLRPAIANSDVVGQAIGF